jgi:hypothetical protein
VLTQAVGDLSPQASAAALEALRLLPEFRDLTSLLQITERPRLLGLLFDPDRYEAVADRLRLAPEARREVFGREMRASRILTAFSSLSTHPRFWLADAVRRHASETFQAAVSEAFENWSDSKVRRIAPRGREPIGCWTAQRTLIVGPTRLIAEGTAVIQEDMTEVEHYIAHARFKFTDWRGGLLTRARLLEMVQNPFLNARRAQMGEMESRFEGVVPGTEHPWQMWYVRRTLAILIASPSLHRRQRKDLGEFFRVVDEKYQDVLGFLSAAPAGRVLDNA